MKKTKKIFLLAGFSLFAVVVSAQSALTFEVSQQYTSFKFIDSQSSNQNSEYKGVFTGAYGVGYNYHTDFGLIIKSGIGMRKGGATMIYDDMSYSWKMQYADAKLGLGYVYVMNRVHPYFIASGYFAYLLSGTQTLNNEQFDIIQSDLLNKMDYGIIFSPGVEIQLTKNMSSYLEFNYLWGLNNIDMDEGQSAANYSYGLTLGLSYMFKK